MRLRRNLDLSKGRHYGPRGFQGLAASTSGRPHALHGCRRMVGDTRDDGGGTSAGDPSSEEAALSARRGQLERQLSALRDVRRAEQDQNGGGHESASARASAMAVGLRLSSELVAGVLVGAAIGWGFDRLVSTSPWGLIVFLLLGFSAGIINVVRSSGAGRET